MRMELEIETPHPPGATTAWHSQGLIAPQLSCPAGGTGGAGGGDGGGVGASARTVDDYAQLYWEMHFFSISIIKTQNKLFLHFACVCMCLFCKAFLQIKINI